MLHNRKLITTSFLLLALCNCFGMELPKDQPLFNTLAQKAPEALPNDEEIEALLGDTEVLFDDHNLAPKRHAAALHNDEKADLGNGNNEIIKGADATPVSKKRRRECFICKKSVANLTTHMRTHTGEKPYHCDQCNYSSTQKGNLTTHVRTHTGEKPYFCEQCNYSCADKSTLTKHLLTHSDEKPFKCNQCDYSCKRCDVLTLHLRTHTGEKPFKCEQCDYSCASSSDLTKHILNHTGEKPYHCNQCNCSFKQSNHLTTHMRTHTGEKPYHCDQCDLSFAQSGNLQTHISKAHQGHQTPTGTKKKDYIWHQVYADTEKK